jgi:hypothetical protein
VLERANASPDLANAFAGGMAHVRSPEDVADLTTPKRRLMPAMMRGNEGLELALTRRMIAKLALADPTAPPGAVVAAAVPAADNAAQTVDYASATRPIFGRVRGGNES